MERGRKLRVVVVDDSEVVRMKLGQLMESEEGFELVGQAPDGEQGLKVVQEQQPDVVIMDLRMPGMSGIEATWQLGTVAPASRVVVLTVSAEQEDVTDAIMAGARGYVVKGADDSEIMAAVRGVAAGERVISPQVAGKLIERVRGDREEGKAQTPSRAAPSAPRVRAPAARGAPTARPARLIAERPAPAPGDKLTGVPAQDALGEMFSRRHVVQTLLIALVVGALLTLIGQGEEIQDGNTDTETWIKAALNVFVAFAVINIGVLVGKTSD
jgi:DNA-binding NarL/FixJ family response regulator